MKHSTMFHSLVLSVAFVLSGCASVPMPSPECIVAGLLLTAVQPFAHHDGARAKSSPARSGATSTAAVPKAAPAATSTPATKVMAQGSEAPRTPAAKGSAPAGPTINQSTANPSEAAPAPTPSAPPESAGSTGLPASTRVLNRILALYQEFHYEEALQLVQDYLQSPGLTGEEQAAAAFLGAAAAYVTNRPAVMDELLRRAIQAGPNYKTDPDTLPRAVCERHQTLLNGKGD